MKRMLLCGSLFFCMISVPIAVGHAEDGGGVGKGLLSGVLNQVESSVKETTESVGHVVESAVEGVDQTVKDTVSFTKGTVETLVDPSTEQPVSEIVNSTVDLVEGTVDNVLPVVEHTTETVEVATSAVTGIVDELPEVPVVTPVVDEVEKVVTETVERVNDTVENVEDEEEIDLTEKVIGNETPVSPQSEEKPTTITPPPEVIEKPVLEKKQETPAKDELTEVDSPEIYESIEPDIEEDITFISNEAPQKTVVSHVKQFANAKKVEERMPAEQESPTTPVQSSTQMDGIPMAITTGTTSVTSSTLSIGGNADVAVGIMDGAAILHTLSGRQWVYSDEQMRIQWVHAPPGQPPQTTPFLHA